MSTYIEDNHFEFYGIIALDSINACQSNPMNYLIDRGAVESLLSKVRKHYHRRQNMNRQ
jgi:hypothetical protein